VHRTKRQAAALVKWSWRPFSGCRRYGKSRPARFESPRGSGRFQNKCEMKAPRIDPAVRELALLSALAALGCGLAAVQGDLWFVTVFGAASVVTMIEVVRRLL
jgi:hypothetical protein